ncbi:MAG: winged helix-turn-helix domain-containing protein [Candidatus Nanopelagicales bacterium]
MLVDGEEVSLTPTEYDVLAYLASRWGTVVRIEDLIEAVWGNWYGQRGHVGVHIHRLRRKLGPCGELIRTKRSIGYMLVKPLPVVGPSAIDLDWTSTALLDILERDGIARGVVWLVVDRERCIMWVSASVEPLLGWGVDEALGKEPLGLFGEVATRERPELFPAEGGDSSVRLSLLRHHPSGDVLTVHVTAHVVTDATGVRLGGIAELRPDALSASPSVLLTFDPESVLLDVSPLVPFLGWVPGDVIGRYFSLAGIDADMSRRTLEAIASAGLTEVDGIVWAVGADGEVTLMRSLTRLAFSEGRMTGYSGQVTPA